MGVVHWEGLKASAISPHSLTGSTRAKKHQNLSSKLLKKIGISLCLTKILKIFHANQENTFSQKVFMPPFFFTSSENVKIIKMAFEQQREKWRRDSLLVPDSFLRLDISSRVRVILLNQPNVKTRIEQSNYYLASGRFPLQNAIYDNKLPFSRMWHSQQT